MPNPKEVDGVIYVSVKQYLRYIVASKSFGYTQYFVAEAARIELQAKAQYSRFNGVGERSDIVHEHHLACSSNNQW